MCKLEYHEKYIFQYLNIAASSRQRCGGCILRGRILLKASFPDGDKLQVQVHRLGLYFTKRMNILD